MFVFNSSAKRRREEDEVCGLEEQHESKRLRSEPFVSSPSTDRLSLFPPKPQFLPRSLSPSFTPIDSSDDEAGNENNLSSSSRPWRDRQSRRPPMLALDTAMDVDMADPHPLINGDNLSPWPVSARSRACGSVQPSPIPHQLINQSLNISGGRTATPIYGHFTLNMHPDKMMGDAGSFGEQAPAVKSPGPQTEEETDWWRRRRLPSPISEGGDAVADLFRGAETSNEGCSNKSAFHKPVVPDSPPSMDVDNQCPSSQWSGTSAVEGGPVKNATDPVVKRNASSGKGKAAYNDSRILDSCSSF
ncbi:hypothetical protein T310_4753 [Rasamsonia emersonii CBS 393.64]|uniref:Uncharacterized protein n=1 Tax=Rasamsonia emersonii (strain ATCC 16479 / CBS 393.64 / IMI 116815) TaxID=1408163 RepID=A0A0F4YSJ6_RASE3|nr:hypothetical protein T310_4753 [Rasamsonia emersonii CBS 393.64]KKA21247.1 hypothetical protein T310_4753 [Rasamsonia emersonii CBS 393.64]